MQLPIRFKIRNVGYTVQPATSQSSVYGKFLWEHQHILVATKHKGRPRKPKDIAETFWHEVTHAILRDMEHPQWDEEAFVSAFSKRLTQVIYTAEFK